MSSNLFSSNQGNQLGDLPKLPKNTFAHNPRIRVKSDNPSISLEEDNLFFNIDGNEVSIDDVANSFGNLFFGN